jgi:hypothetical protein
VATERDLVVVFVRHLPAFIEASPALGQATAALDDLADRLAVEVKATLAGRDDLAWRFETRDGDPATALIDAANELGASLMELTHSTRLSLVMISSRGTKVFPPTGAMTETGDHFRCRFIIKENPGDLPDEDVNQLLARISRRHRWMHIEKLQEFDGELGFTRDQGEN